MNMSTSMLGILRKKPSTFNLENEENASKLKFGQEFKLKQLNNDGMEQNLVALNLSEARVYIQSSFSHRKKIDVNDHNNEEKEDDFSDTKFEENTSNEIIQKTIKFLNNFSRFKNSSSVESVEKLLSEFSLQVSEPLHPFEIAQLGNLECDDYEEAKSLIPSLNNKVTNSQLQNLLNELKKFQSFS